MTAWDFYAWVGIAALILLALRAAHFIVESILVARVGWTTLNALGLCRSIPFAFQRRGDRDNGGAPAGFG